MCKSSTLEILVLWNVAQEEYKVVPTGWSKQRGCKNCTCQERKKKEKEKGKEEKKRKRKKKYKEKKWHILALARQKETRKMVPTRFYPRRISQETSTPHINSFKLANESLSHKVQAELLLCWALRQTSLPLGPLRDNLQFTTAL